MAKTTLLKLPAGRAKKTTVTPPSLPLPSPEKLVIEAGSCPSLSGQSVLGFEVGRDGGDEILLRLVSNSGAGRFSKDWIGLDTLCAALRKAQEPITTRTFREPTRGMSTNNAGFLLAVFKHKGWIEVAPDGGRGYVRAARDAASVEALGGVKPM